MDYNKKIIETFKIDDTTFIYENSILTDIFFSGERTIQMSGQEFLNIERCKKYIDENYETLRGKAKRK